MSKDYAPIGSIRSVFTEKFGVPRQSMMMSEARAILKLNSDPQFSIALNHLENFSHIFVIFIFHQHLEKGWRPTIRPPRLDAPRRVGVFASRSPHRPNPIGISAVKLDRIDRDAPGGIEIHLSGVDLLDGTPVIDIKPYLAYADCIATANAGWAQSAIARYRVTFSPESQRAVEEITRTRQPRFKELVTQMLEWDPRPTSQRRAMPIEEEETQGMVFGTNLFNFDIQWRIENRGIYVLQFIPLT